MWDDLIAATKAVVDTSTLLHEVFDYRRRTFDKYPACTISPADTIDPLFADTSRNQRTYVIAITVYQERLDQGDSNAERILRQIADDLITKFDADPYLGNTIAGRGYAKPIPGAFVAPPDNGEYPDTIALQIFLECVVIQ